ncbi:MAG: hypothetical protein ABFC18_03220 [Rikenellaceae bacterium]
MLRLEGYEWATHQPLIRAVMELYKPLYVLELGPGIYSTPIFLEYKIKYKAIEHNKDWKEFIEKEYSIKVKFHDLRDVVEEDKLSTITVLQMLDIKDFYESLKIPAIQPKLLFVDNAMSCRTIAINTLREQFDLIIYHDHDASGILNNCYDRIEYNGFNSYVLSSENTGACLMVRSDIDKGFDKTQEIIDPYIQLFINKFTDCKQMSFHGMDSGK